MSKLTGVKYLIKGLDPIDVQEEDYYDFILKYSERCNDQLWRIESLLWELDYLKGIPTSFDREAWDNSKVVSKWSEDQSFDASDEVPVFLRKYIESLLDVLQDNVDSLTLDLEKRKRSLGLKNKKILFGIKKNDKTNTIKRSN